MQKIFVSIFLTIVRKLISICLFLRIDKLPFGKFIIGILRLCSLKLYRVKYSYFLTDGRLDDDVYLKRELEKALAIKEPTPFMYALHNFMKEYYASYGGEEIHDTSIFRP